jgi:membrane-associated protease RseP (regulator of RpoE activity)
MIAMNVDQALVSRVKEVGWTAVPPAEREGVSDPYPASREYLDWLYPTFREHQSQDPHDARADEAEPPTDAQLADPVFRRFVEGMLLWDRAMAQGIAERLVGPTPPLAIGILGTGHIRSGYGVPAQLRDLGISRIAGVLPWDATPPCAAPTPGMADAVFVLPPHATAKDAPRPRLGIAFDQGPDGMVVREVAPKSIAEAAGIQPGDVIVQMAGEPVKGSAEMVSTVQRQPPGTWLPIVVRRSGTLIDLVARFPAQP